jgi:hypothetical protein
MDHPVHGAITILTLKIAYALIIFALAATLNTTKLHYTGKNDTT